MQLFHHIIFLSLVALIENLTVCTWSPKPPFAHNWTNAHAQIHTGKCMYRLVTQTHLKVKRRDWDTSWSCRGEQRAEPLAGGASLPSHKQRKQYLCEREKKLFVPSLLICKPDVIHSISSSHTSQVHSVQQKFLPSY